MKASVRKAKLFDLWVLRDYRNPYGRTFFTWLEAILTAVNNYGMMEGSK